MSYQVLARRLRPQRFEDVVGQDHITRTLGNAITGDRLAHAYLFTGVRGVGKTSIARIFAKALNCAEGPTQTPCNKCDSCKEITNGSGVDVLEIDGASNTGVDDVRELRENVRYLPQSSRYKVYIIDEVHMLSTAAFNALLKTLEEPPPHVIFVFATTEPHKIPMTILSRCQRFDFKRISRFELIDGLRKICDREGYIVDQSDIALLAREAEGSMRDALSLLDQVISFTGKEVPKGELAKALGVADRAWISGLAESILTGKAEAALKIIGEAFDKGYNLRELLKELVSYIRHLAVAAVSDKLDDLIDLPLEEIEVIKDLSKRASAEKIQVVFGILTEADERIGKVRDPKSILDMAAIKSSHAEPALPVSQAIRQLAEIEARLTDSPQSANYSPRPQSPNNPPQTQRPRPIDQPEKQTPPPRPNVANRGTLSGAFSFEALTQAVREEGNPLIEAMMDEVSFEKFEGEVLTVSIEKNSAQHETIQRKEIREKIENVASRIYGEKITLKVIDKIGDGKKEISKETDLERAIKQEAQNNPLIKNAQEILDAKIVEVRTKVKKPTKAE